MRARSDHLSRLAGVLLRTAACLGGGAWAGDAAADEAPRDAQAEKALSEAMGGDYLQTKFDDAVRRLRAAVEACGETGCSRGVKVRLLVALGSVLAQGKKQLEDARDTFADALRLDPETKPDPALSTTEIAFAFEQARAAVARAGGGALSVAPVQEQRLSTPVPLFAELRADLLDRAKQVTAWYLAPGAQEYRALVMKKLRDRGFGINVPCSDVGAEGTLRYYVTAESADGAILASAGSRDAPLTAEIKGSIATEPPHWPGFAPPATCAKIEEAQPKQCLDDRQCNAGLACVRGACAPRPPAPPPASDVRRNWASLAFWPDVTLFSGSDVCSLATQQSEHFVCLRANKTRYDGTPTKGVADNVRLGFALSTVRVALGYDRLVLNNVTVGGRIGLAAGGAHDGGASFLPVHVEARAQYFLDLRPFARVGARPFALVSAGVAQIDTPVDVNVLEDAGACGASAADINSPCTKPGRSGVVEARQQTLKAYKQAGQGFGAIGAGISYAPIEGMTLNLAVRASVTLPVVTAVFSPELGVGLGF